MAARVNTKFLILLLIVLFTVSGIAAFLYVYQLRQDAGRNARIGDEYLAEGNLGGAREHYGRAVRKEPGNYEYLNKYESVLLQIEPQTIDRANELFQQRLSVLRHGAQHHPLNADDHIRLIEQLHRFGRLTGDPSYYELLESSADNMFDRVHVDDPKRPYGRLYRAIGRFNQRIYTAEELEESETDLRIFLDEFPEDEFGWAVLVNAQWTLSDLLTLSGQTRRAQEKYDDAQASLRTAIQTGVDSLEMAKIRFMDVLQRSEREPASVTDEEKVDAFRYLVSWIKPDSPPWSIIESMRLLQSARTEELRTDVMQALEDVIEANPDHPVLRVQIGSLYYGWAKYDMAEEHIRALLDAEPLPVGILSLLQFNMKVGAAGLLADIEYQRWVKATDSETRQRHITALQEARDLVATLASQDENNLVLIRIEGKLAFAKQDYAESARHFEQLLKSIESQSNTQIVENLAFAIHSHEQLGNTGLAHERTVLALEYRPKFTELRLKKARLELAMRQYEQASETLQDLLQDEPENDTAIRLKAVADTRGDSSTLVSDDPVINALNAAQTAWKNGEREEVRSILLPVLQEQPENLDLLLMSARLELNLENRQGALEYANRGLNLKPNSPLFKQVKALAENTNRVDVILELTSSLHPDDRQTAEATKILSFASLIADEEALLQQAETAGDADAIREKQAILARAEREIANAIAYLEKENPDHPVLIENRLNDAIAREDWETASNFVERAARLDLDDAGGDLFRAQLQIARGEYDAAVRTLLDVTGRMEYMTRAWTSLGFAYERLGNFAEAARAYQQSYRGNPNRLDVIRAYGRVLVQTGESTRALDVLRHARNLAPNDVFIKNSWLDLEASVGDSSVALKERRKWYEEEPDEKTNAFRLAALLGRLEPDRISIVNADGEPRFNERAWVQMSPSDRQQIVETTKSQWHNEADAIVDAVSSDQELTLSIAALRSELLRSRGDVSGGEQVLREFIASQPEGEHDPVTYVVLGRYLAEADRNADAIEAFQTGLQYQDETTHTVDIALADLYFHMNRKEEALTHFKRVLAAEKNPGLQMRAVECLVDLEQLDEAQALLDETVQDNGTSFTTWLLSSAILEQEGDQLATKGKDIEAQFKYQEFQNALENAQRLRPGDVLPKLRQARHLLREFNRSDNRQSLDEALRVLSEADQITADDSRVSLVRVDVLRSMGDTRAAVAELNRLLTRRPGESQARNLLVTILVSEGNVDEAIQFVQAGIAHNATLPLWHIQLGDLYLNYKQDAEAAVQPFLTALTLQPSAEFLKRVARAQLLAGHDPNEVVDFIGQYPQFQRSDTGVIGLLVRALAMGNRPQDIESVLRQMYGRLGDLIRQGVLDSKAMSAWFRVAREGLSAYKPEQVEALLMDLSASKPSGHEMSSMAFLYRLQSDSASRSRALQLQEQALAGMSDAPQTAQSPYYYDYGTMLIETGQFGEAADAFKKAFELNPEHALAYNNYAYLMSEELGNPQAAIEPAKKAAQLQPNNAPVQDTLGWVHYQLKQYDEAEAAIRRSLDLSRIPPTLVHLAEVLIAKGELDRAMTGPLREADELQPDEETKARINELLDEIQTRRARGE